MRLPIGIKNAMEELYDVRQQIKMLKSTEEELSFTVKNWMQENELDEVEGKTTYAELNMRPYRVIDPEEYWEILEGDIDKFLETVNVRLENDKRTGRLGASNYLSEEQIADISEISEVPVLSVKKLVNKKENIKASVKLKTQRA